MGPGTDVVAYFMVALDALVVTTALPAVHREIGGSLSTLDWAVNAYLLTFAAGIVNAAALGDRLGRRRCYTLGLVVFTASSVSGRGSPGSPRREGRWSAEPSRRG